MRADWVILHAGALGDLALTLHLALRLPRISRESRLHLVSRVNAGDLSAGRPAITRQSSDSVALHWLYMDSDDAPASLESLVAGHQVLSALGDPAGPAHRRLQQLAPARLLSFDPRSRPESAAAGRHILQQWQCDLEAQGVQFDRCVYRGRGALRLWLPDSFKAAGRSLLRARGAAERLVVIQPGSGGADKCWPLAGFVSLARRLVSKRVGVVVLLGPAELERWPDEQLAALRAEFATLEHPQPAHLAEALAAADLFLGNDSGPGHLAALLGAATLSLFGPTSAQRWHPVGWRTAWKQGRPDAGADWGIRAEELAQAALQMLASAQ